MARSGTSLATPSRIARRCVLAALALGILGLSACGSDEQEAAVEIRPVRTVTVERRDAGVPVVLTGRIEAEDEAAMAFRLSGRLVERLVNLGSQVEPGQLIGRLDPVNELNALRSAEAALNAARGQLVEARADFRRQQTLAERGFAAQAVYDRARAAQQTAESNVQSAEAMLKLAQDQVSFTELHADAEGVVTTVGAEPGEVVQAGQMVVRLAREQGRDAVFDVPAQVIREAPAEPIITVTLADDPRITATGRVREVAPTANPVTRTFEVKVGLASPPPQMRLGATVVGRMEVDVGEVIEIPATALTQGEREPAVWVVDGASSTVALRPVVIERFGPGTITIEDGLAPGDIVVTAGVQALHPGQKVRMLEARP